MSAIEYNAWILTEDATSGPIWSMPNHTSPLVSPYAIRRYLSLASLTYLSSADCKSTFDTAFVSRYSNVLVVTNATNVSSSIVQGIRGGLENNGWIEPVSTAGCQPINSPSAGVLPADFRNCPAPAENASWNFTYFAEDNNVMKVAVVRHCLAEEVPTHCSILLHPGLLATVIICIAIKLICLISLFRQRSFYPLTTIGDAIASFMAFPEEKTREYGPVTEDYVLKYLKMLPTPKPKRGQRKIIYRPACVEAPPKASSRSWFAGVYRARWHLSVYLCFQYIVVVAAVVGFSAQMAPFGDLTLQALFLQQSSAPISALALIANLPQLALSGLYFLYNGLYTSMLLSREWTRFAVRRQGLRVSRPVGMQRLAYRLTVPLPLAVPVVAAAATAHWLQSQSLFLAILDVRDADGKALPGVQCLGYSTKAWIVTVATQTGTLLAIIGLGFLRYPAGIPLVRGCSLAISAACHPSRNGAQQAVGELKYGVLVKEAEGGGEGVGFSCEEVGSLDPEKTYGKGIERPEPDGSWNLLTPLGHSSLPR